MNKREVNDLQNRIFLPQLTAVSDFLNHKYYTHQDQDKDLARDNRRALVGCDSGRNGNDVDGKEEV